MGGRAWDPEPTRAQVPQTQPPTWAEIRKIVAEELAVPEERVIPSARFREDPNADYPDMHEIILKFGSEFGTAVREDDEDMLITVQDAIDYANSPDSFRESHGR